MNQTLKKILKPVASLRLTVVLLFLSMILVYAGTSAQKETGIWEVQHWYFHSFVSFIPLKYALPLSDWWWQHAPDIHFRLPAALGGAAVNGVPFPGGFVLIALLLLNLLAAHSVRFKFTWKRAGILMIHFGLILLLVGEILTSQMAVEGIMPLNNGDSRSYVDDIRDYELAVIDPSPADHDTVVTVAASRLAPQGLIHDARLPFDVRVDKYYLNSKILGPQQAVGTGLAPEADAGANAKLVLQKLEPLSGVGEDAEGINAPGAYVTLLADGKSLGTYLLKVEPARMVDPGWTKPQEVKVNGKTYLVQLRFKRVYKPYTIHLVKFSHDTYLGTEMASNFASKVRLLDPANGMDREAVISMNHPLRYHNDTLYQQSTRGIMGVAEGTTLQVVTNPNWLLPYFAVVIGGLGLLIHFGMTLTNFLRKRGAAVKLSPMGIIIQGFVAGLSPAYGEENRSRRGHPKSGRKRPAEAAAGESYSLEPEPRWKSLLPLATVALAVIVIACFFASAVTVKESGPFNLDGFAKLPVWEEGRTMPMDSLARNNLKIIHGTQSFQMPVQGQPDKTQDVPAIRWLLDLWSRPEVAADYKVFRVDNQDVKGILGLKENEKFFSWNELFRDRENREKIQKQAEQASHVAEKDQDAFQAKVLELFHHAQAYMKLARGADYVQLYELRAHQDQAQALVAQAEALKGVDPKTLTADQQRILERYRSVNNAMEALEEPQRILRDKASIPDDAERQLESRLADQERKRMDLYVIAPPQYQEGEKNWVGLGQAVLDYYVGGAADLPTTAGDFFATIKDYRDGRADVFNADLSAYSREAGRTAPKADAKAAFEVFFNRFDPFLICQWFFYLGVLLLIFAYWLTGGRPLRSAALALLALTAVVHTAGLASRIYISGRPPVTNLYSSAIFIAWAAVLLCIGIEVVYRKGFGCIAAAVIGFASLQIADALAHRDADTMAQLQAVLDTNFWLATHVVCVTLGYAATFLAGILATVYVVGNLVTGGVRGNGGMEANSRKELARMTYGVVCFAMLFSFVGTILGGIWADQSWGRFWGWDPKENGAVLIVLWNALILHARWGGMIKEKGLMLLAIGGNIITSWSWFGTNMLGIGLHSYGFMGKAFFYLTGWVILQIVLIIAGSFVNPGPSRPALAGSGDD